jgi:hypothetical protein
MSKMDRAVFRVFRNGTVGAVWREITKKEFRRPKTTLTKTMITIATLFVLSTSLAAGDNPLSPFEILEMVTRFEEGNLISDLVGVAPEGSRQTYRETWEVTDDDHYTWTLYLVDAEGETEMMSGRYERAMP